MHINRSDWQLKILTTWEEIEDTVFQKRWTELAEQAVNANVFFHPILIKVWLKTYRPLRNLTPLFVHATHADQEVIFPLVLWCQDWKNAFLRVIIPAGHSDFDYHDPLFLKAEGPGEIAGFYAALFDALNQTISYDRMLIDGLHLRYLPSFSKVIHSEVCLSWSLREAVTVDGLILPAKKRLAQDVRRRYRRIQELGAVRFHKFTASGSVDEQKSLSTMLVMHARRWPNAYKAPDFHRRLIEEGVRAGLVDVVEMSLDGLPIAWQISFSYRGRYSLYMPTVDEKYMQYGPGHLSLGFALAEEGRNGMSIVDHLRGGEDYKNAWGGFETLIYDVAQESETPMSRVRIWVHEALRRVRFMRSGNEQREQG